MSELAAARGARRAGHVARGTSRGADSFSGVVSATLSQPRVRQVLCKLADNSGEAWRRDRLLRVQVSVVRVWLFADSQKALGQSVILIGGRLDPGWLAMIVGKRCS